MKELKRIRNELGKKRNRIICFMFLLFVLLSIFFIWQNNDIVTTRITCKSKRIPKEFDSYRIVQVSDLHNKEFGKKGAQLVQKVKKAKPDIIVVTGDLVDGSRTNIKIAMEFIHEAVKIAPVYYVTGNHEASIPNYYELAEQMTQSGVILLDNNKVVIKRNEASIELLGLMDPQFTRTDYLEESTSSTVNQKLHDLMIDRKTFKILLSHRPELMDTYADNKLDLVFAGHAHGGQFRIPYICGIYAPNQGWFPKYTSGIYRKKNTSMVVSRGLGNSVFPIRIFNRPEIVVVTLKTNQNQLTQ